MSQWRASWRHGDRRRAPCLPAWRTRLDEAVESRGDLTSALGLAAEVVPAADDLRERPHGSCRRTFNVTCGSRVLALQRSLHRGLRRASARQHFSTHSSARARHCSTVDGETPWRLRQLEARRNAAQQRENSLRATRRVVRPRPGTAGARPRRRLRSPQTSIRSSYRVRPLAYGTHTVHNASHVRLCQRRPMSSAGTSGGMSCYSSSRCLRRS